MAKVVGIHQLSLKEGVRSTEFERFFSEEFVPAWADVPGLKLSLLRGDKGVRKGEYLAIFECESVEVRDQLFPAEGSSEAIRQRQDLISKYSTFISFEFTDYVEL